MTRGFPIEQRYSLGTIFDMLFALFKPIHRRYVHILHVWRFMSRIHMLYLVTTRGCGG